MGKEKDASSTHPRSAFLLHFSHGGKRLRIDDLRSIETWSIRHRKAKVGDEVYFLQRERLKTLEQNSNYVIGRGHIVKGPYPQSEYEGDDIPLGWAASGWVVDVRIEEMTDAKKERPITLAQLSILHAKAKLWHWQPNGMLLPEDTAEMIRNSKQWKTASPVPQVDLPSATPAETTDRREVEVRIGQQQFREKLLQYWKSCSVTGCSFQEILIASHIVPWSEASDSERLDVFNGLLLTPNLDKLFDNYFISFNSCGEILISKAVSSKAMADLGINPSMKLRRTDEVLCSYLRKHERAFLEKEQAR